MIINFSGSNLAAHALLSAVEFQVTGKDPLTGAVAGVTGEATAEIIARVYGKKPSELTANEKENISTLSQITGGLVGALTAKANGTTGQQGGEFLTAVSGAETAKQAVENNFLKEIYQNPEYASSLLLKAKGDEIKGKVEEKATEEGIDVIDEYAPHYVSLNLEVYGIGYKGVLNLRDFDTIQGMTFSPLVVPTRIGASGTVGLGWITNLDKRDIRNSKNNRITNVSISNALSGSSAGISGCYKFVCAGYGKSISSNPAAKEYKSFELGIGRGVSISKGNSSGSITLEHMPFGDKNEE